MQRESKNQTMDQCEMVFTKYPAKHSDKFRSSDRILEANYETLNVSQLTENQDSTEGATTKYYLQSFKCRNTFSGLSNLKERESELPRKINQKAQWRRTHNGPIAMISVIDSGKDSTD